MRKRPRWKVSWLHIAIISTCVHFRNPFLKQLHWPGPGTWDIWSCFGRPRRENAGILLLPFLVMLEGIRYLGPGEQFVFTSSWRAPKENIGALHLVGSCWEAPFQTRGSHVTFKCINNVSTDGTFNFAPTYKPRKGIFGPRAPIESSYRPPWSVRPPRSDPKLITWHCFEKTD